MNRNRKITNNVNLIILIKQNNYVNVNYLCFTEKRRDFKERDRERLIASIAINKSKSGCGTRDIYGTI